MVSQFLATRSDLRLLSLEDVGRWKKDFEEGHYDFKPFALGDANGDRRLDVAAVLVKEQPKKLYSVVCFNGIRSGLYSRPMWLIVNGEEPILSIEIKNKGILPISCHECDANAFFEWTGTDYDFFLPGDTISLGAGTRVYARPRTNSEVVFTVPEPKSRKTNHIEADILAAGPLLSKHEGVLKRWYKIRGLEPNIP